MKLSSLLCSVLLLTFAHAGSYTVQKGDTLHKIATKNKMSVAQLIKINGIKDPNKLAVGQTLKTSGSTTANESKGSATHEVAKGDTFYGIARKHGISVKQLTALNPNLNPSQLGIGQTLKITGSPAAAVASKPATAPVSQPAPREEIKQAQTQPAPAPQQAPPAQPVLAKAMISEPITFADFAAKHNMTVSEINKLNGWNYSDSDVFDTGSWAYIIQK